MKVVSLSTHKIDSERNNIFDIIDKYVRKLGEGNILAITSKIISISQGDVVKKEDVSKEELIRSESNLYIPKSQKMHAVTLTIKSDILISTAGIDESNGNGRYVLWPKNAQKNANLIRNFLKKHFKLKKVGVIITDSRSTPFRRGAIGLGMAFSGFKPLNDYVNKPDIFGKKLKVTKSSTLDNLASAAVIVMGEGREQTPLAIISDLPFVKFVDRNPSKKELEELKINLDEDLFSALFKKDVWKKGGST